VAARLRDSGVCEHLVAALDDWATVTNDPKRRAWLLEVARHADPDAWRGSFRNPKVWRDQATLQKLADELLRDEPRLGKLKPQLLTALGDRLRWAKGDAIPLLVAAQAHHPDDFWLNFTLAKALHDARNWDDAVGFYRAAAALRPCASAVHNNLGNALAAKDQLDAAIEEYRRAVILEPREAKVHKNLGRALAAKQQLDGAIDEYRTAIALDPNYAGAHNDLGVALQGKQHLEEAIEELRTAITLDPNYAPYHYNLGHALYDKQQLDAAIQEYRTAIALDPQHVSAHTNLGIALYHKRQLDAAIEEYRTAIALDSKHVRPHLNLGIALYDKRQLEAAIQEYRTAIALDPKDAKASHRLGNALRENHQLDAAIQEYRRAIALDPKYASAYGDLGRALLRAGRFAEARGSTHRCLELLRPDDPLREQATRQLKQCEHLLVLEQKLVATLAGKEKLVSDAERLALAGFCQQPHQQRYAASARFYAEAFTHDAQLAEDMQAQHRYNAACAAALAGCGQGADPLAEKERTRLRQQAIAWLRADLAYWSRQAQSTKPGDRARVRQTLQRWQQDTDLAGLRDKDAVAKLSADERQACEKLWADVAELLKKAEEKPQ
jgi:tetratricopeptide (TPR) repeat protein